MQNETKLYSGTREEIQKKKNLCVILRSSEEIEKHRGAARTHLEAVLQRNSHGSDLMDDLQRTSTLPAFSAEKRFKSTLLHRLPQVLIEKIEQPGTEQSYKSRILDGLNMAYFIVNGELFLWDYELNTCCRIHTAENNVLDVKLIKPKVEIFADEVQFALVLACKDTISLLPYVPDKDQHFNFTASAYRISIPNQEHLTISSTDKGRIFLGGDKGAIFEFEYFKEPTLFRGICSFTNLTRSFFDSLRFFSSKRHEKILKIVIDNQRNALYTLNQSGDIGVFSLGKDGNEFNIIQTLPSPLPQAKHAIGYPYANKLVKLIDIHAIPLDDSKQLRVVVTTSSGAFIFLKGSKEAIHDIATGIEFYHIRPASDNVLKVNEASYFKKGIRIINVVKDDLNNQGSIESSYFESLEHNNQSRLGEVRTKFEIQGRILSIKDIPPESKVTLKLNDKDTPAYKQCDDLKAQYYCDNKKFLILTSTGIYKVRKLHPIDLIYEHYDVEGIHNVDFDDYIKFYGASQFFAMVLSGIISYPHSLPLELRKFDLEKFQSGPTIPLELKNKLMVLATKISGFPKLVKDIGDPDKVYGPSPIIKLEKSNAYDGLLNLMSIILKPMWKTFFLQTVQKKDNSTCVLFNFSTSFLDFISYNLLHLMETTTNLPFYTQSRLIKKEDGGLFQIGIHDQSATKEELGILFELTENIHRILQAINFFRLLIMLDSINIFNSLPQSILTGYKRVTLEFLIVCEGGPKFLDEVFLELIKRKKDMNLSITNYARKYCASIYDPDMLVVLEGREQLFHANFEKIQSKRSERLLVAERAFQSTKSAIPAKKLELIISDLCRMGYQSGALKLVASSIAKVHQAHEEAEKKKDPLMINMTKFTKEKESLNISEYLKLVEIPLDSINPIISNFYGVFENSKEYRAIRDNIANALRLCDDKRFHYAVYEWFLKNNLISLLLDFAAQPLETYLKDFIDEAHFELLIRLYSHKKRYFAAASALRSRANSLSGLEIEQRFKLLERVPDFLLHPKAIDRPPNYLEFLDDLKVEKEILYFQKYMINELIATKPDTEDRQLIIQKLKDKIYDYQTLLSSFSETLGMLEAKLIAMTLVPKYEELSNQIKDTWTKLISEVFDNQDNANAAEVLCTRIVRVLKYHTPTSPKLEIRFLALYLSELSLHKGAPITLEWVIDTLFSGGVPITEIFDAILYLATCRVERYLEPSCFKKVANALLYIISQLPADTNSKMRLQPILHSGLNQVVAIQPSIVDEVNATLQSQGLSPLNPAAYRSTFN